MVWATYGCRFPARFVQEGSCCPIRRRPKNTPPIWAKVGIWGGCGEALIKRGHAVGSGYFLVLIPSKECGAIGCAINLGRTRNSACRFAHGAGRTRFLRVRSTARVRANILNLPARIFGSEGVSAHFGSSAESNTQKPASFSLEFRKKGHRESWSDLCTLYHYIPLG